MGENRLSSRDRAELEELARQGRALVLESVRKAGAGHIGAPLSAMEILATLYFRVLRVDPTAPTWPDRDRFVLSKGHAAIGLYAVLALRGFFPVDELATFDHMGSRLAGHPDMTVLPGLDMSTGSLGQGLSVGLGMALGLRRQGRDARVYVLLGDGECQEGQVWEAAHAASRLSVSNLIAIVDQNGLPQFAWPGAKVGEVAQPDFAARFRAFGWHVTEIDGHDVAAVYEAVTERIGDSPHAVIAHTVKGRGVSFAEGSYLWHSRVPTDAELTQALAELGVSDSEAMGGIRHAEKPA